MFFCVIQQNKTSLCRTSANISTFPVVGAFQNKIHSRTALCNTSQVFVLNVPS